MILWNRSHCVGRRPAARRPRRGFTLVELLIVIIIIGLLATILMPALQAIINRAKNVRTHGRISELQDGALSYKHENQYYPGQLYPELLVSNLTVSTAARQAGIPQHGLTGTQMLAACVFDFKMKNIDEVWNPDHPDRRRHAGSKFAANRPGDLTEFNVSGEKWCNVISDRFERGGQAKGSMPVLYFPSRPGVDGLSQYEENDNAPFTAGAAHVNWRNRRDAGNPSFEAYITNDKLGTIPSAWPYNPDQFLLIAAGPDRKYGTIDDITNW